jgi:hypothetical protein
MRGRDTSIHVGQPNCTIVRNPTRNELLAPECQPRKNNFSLTDPIIRSLRTFLAQEGLLPCFDYVLVSWSSCFCVRLAPRASPKTARHLQRRINRSSVRRKHLPGKPPEKTASRSHQGCGCVLKKPRRLIAWPRREENFSSNRTDSRTRIRTAPCLWAAAADCRRDGGSNSDIVKSVARHLIFATIKSLIFATIKSKECIRGRRRDSPARSRLCQRASLV